MEGSKDNISYARGLLYYLGVTDVVVVDALWLGWRDLEKFKTDDKPQGKSGSQVNDLKKARMLKDCNSYKAVFVSLSFTFAERQRICELYVELHKRNDEDVASIISIVVALYRTGR